MVIWQGVLLSLFCGFFGGIANLLINSESAIIPRFFVDNEGNKHLIYGLIKPLVLGVIAGPIAVFNMYESLAWYQIAYLSIVSGIAGGATLTTLANRVVSSAKRNAEAEQDQFDVQQKTG